MSVLEKQIQQLDIGEAALLNALSFGAFVLDKQRVVHFWNQRIAEWTNISTNEIQGRHISEFFPAFTDDWCEQQLTPVFENGSSVVVLSSCMAPQPEKPGFYSQSAFGEKEISVTPVAIQPAGENAALFIIQEMSAFSARLQSYRINQKNNTGNTSFLDKNDEKEFQRLNQKLGLHFIKRTAALVASDERYRSLFENVPSALFEVHYGKLRKHLLGIFENYQPFAPEAFLAKYPQAITEWLQLLHIENANKVALQMYGANFPSELTPENTLFNSEDSRKMLLSQLKAFWKSQSPFVAEFDTTLPDGNAIYLSFRAAIAPGSQKSWQKILISVVDITARKVAERELEHAREVLERRVLERTAELAETNWALKIEVSERQAIEYTLRNTLDELKRSNRELDEFASIASHDLKEPLRKVQTFGDRLRHYCESKLDDRAMDYLSRMENAAKRMETFIDSLLSLSRVTTKARPFVPVDLENVCKEVLRDLEIRIEQTCGEVRMAPLPTIDADALQMHQLFQNLIGNALKFHKPDTPPIVEIFTETPPDNDDGQCILIIQDNGIGIPQSHREQVFKPFQRLHSRSTYEGTGMGLAICQKIVNRHSGTINISESAAKGSRFEIVLPVRHIVPQKEPDKKIALLTETEINT
ncbi:MAG: ATP-binding protein [Calditrichia bacterium]